MGSILKIRLLSLGSFLLPRLQNNIYEGPDAEARKEQQIFEPSIMDIGHKIQLDNSSLEIPALACWGLVKVFLCLLWLTVLGAIHYGYIFWILNDQSPNSSEVLAWIFIGFVLVVVHFCTLPVYYIIFWCIGSFPYLIVRILYVIFISSFGVLAMHRLPKAELEESLCSLCSICQPIVDNCDLFIGGSSGFIRSHSSYDFHTLESLSKSAESCHLCSILMHSIDKTKPGQPRSTALRLKIWSQVYCLRKTIFRMKLAGRSIKKSTTLKVDAESAVRKPISHQCSKSIQTDSHDVVEWAKSCIDNCSKVHQRCQGRFIKADSRSYLPKRLIDTQNYAASTVAVIESKDLLLDPSIPRTKYLALSHCWGGSIGSCLEKKNRENMKEISVTGLPKNFQDAISITPKLGYRYLWIDSLCITQDDELELQIESNNMGLLYANSACVISATASVNSSGGLFRNRELFRYDCPIINTKTHQIIVRSEFRPKMAELFTERIEFAALSHRAWSFQERYLGSRILHFSSGGALFECNQSMACDHSLGQIDQAYPPRQLIRNDGKLHSDQDCEHATMAVPEKITQTKTYYSEGRGGRDYNGPMTVTEEVPNPAYQGQQDHIKNLTRLSARSGLRGTFDFLWMFSGQEALEKIEFHQIWYDMIKHYSRRRLTRHKDKLIAISGVASFIQQNTELIYNSGLWEQHLDFNLLWINMSKPQKRPVRLVPSWSWASIDGTISHRLSEAIPPAHNQFRSSWTELTPLLHGKIQVVDSVHVDNQLILNSTLEIEYKPIDYQVNLVNVIWDIEQKSDESLFLLPVLSFVNPKVHPLDSAKQLHGIVIRHKSEIEYERVGYFWTNNIRFIARCLEVFNCKSKDEAKNHEDASQAFTDVKLHEASGPVKQTEKTIIRLV